MAGLTNADLQVLKMAADQANMILAPVAAKVASQVDVASAVFPQVLQQLCLLAVNTTQTLHNGYSRALAGNPDGSAIWVFPDVVTHDDLHGVPPGPPPAVTPPAVGTAPAPVPAVSPVAAAAGALGQLLISK